jgi:hypothetical protein
MSQPPPPYNPFMRAVVLNPVAGRSNGFLGTAIHQGFVPPKTGLLPWQTVPSNASPAHVSSTRPAVLASPITKSDSTKLSNNYIYNDNTPYGILRRWGQALTNFIFEPSSKTPTLENPLPVASIVPNRASIQAPTFAAGQFLSISQLRKQALGFGDSGQS